MGTTSGNRLELVANNTVLSTVLSNVDTFTHIILRLTMASVLVSNLSKNATEQMLQEFFSFTGSLEAITIKEETEVNSAIVKFTDASSLETALLLDGASIAD